MQQPTVFTIGHSTHPIDEFIDLLRNNGVQQLVDVRTVPGSRHNPQFGAQALERSLTEVGLLYARDHVCGSRAVALSPVSDRRCAPRSTAHRERHHERHIHQTSHPHLLRRGGRPTTVVPADYRGRAAVIRCAFSNS